MDLLEVGFVYRVRGRYFNLLGEIIGFYLGKILLILEQFVGIKKSH